ncbi:MAG: hypothetical protein K2M14_05700 [Muribaculaceae bacterium]|nr:hypothetical protein [Muribaculaceae bacterium]
MLKKYFICIAVALIAAAVSVAAEAKPRCNSFSNRDDKVTIVFTDDKAGSQYKVTDAKLQSRRDKKSVSATSVSTSLSNGMATVVLTFPYETYFSNPKVTLMVNGKKMTFKVCN